MVVVKKKKGESEDSLIRRFREQVLRSGVLQTARDRSRFKSKAEERKENKAAKKYRIKKAKERNY
jgi:ribosomal protein S21